MKLKGSVTVFLSLMLSAFLVLLQSLTYGLTIQNGKNYRKADTLRAVECVFAEYRKELWETYGIFAIDGSYEKETVTSIKSVEENIEDRISFYDEGMLAHQLSDILLLTDNSGQSLHTQILKTMEKKYGMEVLKDAEKKEQILQKTEEEKGNVAEELNGIKEQFEHLENQEIEDGENPLKQLASVFSGSLLGMVFPKDKSLSAKNVEIKTLPSGRKNIQGHGTFEQPGISSKLLEKAYTGAYIKDTFGNVVSRDPGNAGFEYEIEYLLQGKESDEKNLESTVGELVLLRFFPNYICIQQDEKKKAEAKIAAAAIAVLLLIPEMTDAISQILLAAWSYGESVSDVKTLLAGGKVPFEKTKDSWRLSLSGIWNMSEVQASDQGEGWEYEDYLQLLLLKEETKDLNMRILDLIELNMKESQGCTFFRADTCVCAIKVDSTGVLPGEITYRFDTEYGYQ